MSGEHPFTGILHTHFVISADSFGEPTLEEQIRRLYHTVGKAKFNDVHIGLSKGLNGNLLN